MHADPFGGHELEYSLQVLPHPMDGFGVVLDPGDFLARNDFDQLGQNLARLEVGAKILNCPQVWAFSQLRVNPGDVRLQLSWCT